MVRFLLVAESSGVDALVLLAAVGNRVGVALVIVAVAHIVRVSGLAYGGVVYAAVHISVLLA